MSRPKVYLYKGDEYTITEILDLVECTKNRWQLAWSLRHGKTMEEALAPSRTYEGKVHKNWTVLRLSHIKRNGRRFWVVQCNNCGREVVKDTARVNMDRMCDNCNHRPRGESGIRQLLATYRGGAARRNLPFKLSLEDFKRLTSGNCAYCGITPGRTIMPRRFTNGTDWGDYKCNGIDRMDSAQGYKLNNCVSCCGLCNLAKKEMPFDEFIEYLKRVASYVNDGGLDKLSGLVVDGVKYNVKK